MKYLGKILLSIREIFFMMIIHYLFLFICVLIIGFDKSIIWGSVILSIIEIIYILYKTKGSIFRYKKDSCLLPYIMIGIGITCIYNMIIFKLGLGFEVNTNVNVVINIFCSGIIGPIFEEVLFRYDLISRLEKFNSNKWVIIIISSIIFGLFHTNIITIIYAIIVGFINSYIYVKDKHIIKPILIHMSANLFVNLLDSYNFIILILGIILIIISTLIIKKND